MNEEIRNENLVEETVSPEPQIQKMTVAKIITAIITVLAMGYLLYLDVDIIVEIQSNGWAALGWMVIMSVYAPILCGICLIVSGINLVRAIVKIKKKLITKETLIYFIVLTIIPILFLAFTIWGVRFFAN